LDSAIDRSIDRGRRVAGKRDAGKTNEVSFFSGKSPAEIEMTLSSRDYYDNAIE